MINQEEYQALNNLNKMWKWIARDEDGELYVYTTTPHKGAIYWINEDPMFGGIDDNLFQFIQWEDSEPYSIAELIEEYESQSIETYNVQKELEELDRLEEIEEIEAKNIGWIRGEFEKIILHYLKDEDPMLKIEVLNKVSDLFHQLDEPEVTLDKAFDKVAESYSMTKEEVWRHLERLEVRTGVLSQEWFDSVENNAIETVFQMRNGYEIENVSEYIIRVKGLYIVNINLGEVVDVEKNHKRSEALRFNNLETANAIADLIVGTSVEELE